MQISTPRVRELAREGMRRQGGQTYQNARTIGESYLRAISQEAGSSLEGIVARVAHGASAERLYPQSAYQAQNLALAALASGVTGPVGPVLASIGYDAMYKSVWHEASMAYHDGRSLGASFLSGISTHSQEPNEKALARVAVNSAAQHLYNQTAFNLEAEALKTIKSGVGGHDPARVLAQVGRSARMKAYNNEDARKIIYPFLEAIGTSSDPRTAALGDVGRKASGAYLHQDSGSLAQDVALAKVLEGPRGTIEQDLADYGTRALDHCSYAEDQRHIGLEVLRGIKRHSSDPAVRLLAKAADEATCLYLRHRSAAGAHYDAFSLIAQGSGAGADVLLSRFGLAAQKRGETSADGRTMGHSVLSALAQNESDEVRRGVLESALKLSSEAPNDQVALGLQKFAFNWLQKAPSLPPAAPGESGDALDPALLEQRIEFHNAVRQLLQDQKTDNTREIGAKQARMVTLADEFNPLVEVEHALIRRSKRARLAFFVGAGAAVGGLLARSFLPPAVSLGLVGVGALTGLTGWTVNQRALAERTSVLARYWPLRNAYDQLQGEQQALGAAIGVVEAMDGQLEQAVRKDQMQLDVLKMGPAVSSTPDPGSITIDADEVTIGGFTVGYRTDDPVPDDQAPAVSADGRSRPTGRQANLLPEPEAGSQSQL